VTRACSGTSIASDAGTEVKGKPVSKIGFAALALMLGLINGPAPGATRDAAKDDAAKGAASKPAPAKGADVAKAETARKKPLQRCDELADKAQLECLQKARERIVAARQKREASGKSAGKGPAKAAPPREAPKK
jgi:hypothetical protein